jgi:glycosyltransferase involved in cell wall biosynthesis
MNRPFVTIIMPIRNEADCIARSLGAVLNQDYPPEQIEVLIADGMSSDATRAEIARAMAAQPHMLVKVLDNPGRIVPTGMNIALAQSRGEIVIRVDGHTLIAPDYVTACVEALSHTGADNVGGRMTAVGQTGLSRVIALATSSPFGVGGARFHYSDREEWVDTVYMGAWRRDVFQRIGLFDEELVRNQDDEFNYRLLANGGKILLSDKIKSSYYNRSNLRALWRQYLQYGYWKVRVMQKHPRQMRMRQFAPPVFVATAVGGAVLAPYVAPVLWLWLGVLSLYAALNLAVSFRLASQKGWPYLRWLPVVFATLHIGYGLGFLVGLVRFAGRWDSKTGKRA